MSRLTAEQVAEQIESGITGRESDWADGHDCASRVAARLIRSNLIESPDERRERFERWYGSRFTVCPSDAKYENGEYCSNWMHMAWLGFNAALDFGGGGGT